MKAWSLDFNKSYSQNKCSEDNKMNSSTYVLDIMHLLGQQMLIRHLCMFKIA